jgi:hypothetical protein
MIGLAFSHPWMLAALAAVGLPVLIHFLTRARPRRVPFPPYRFLVQACAGQQSVHRLRTLALLALRCLAIAALVLWFAQPYRQPSAPAQGPGAARRVVILVDASMSMRAVQQGMTHFSRAQSGASDLLRGLDPGSEAAVILAARTPRPLLPALSRNLPALHNALVSAQPTFEIGDPSSALESARQWLGVEGGTIEVFSDFQRSNWERVKQLPPGIAVRLHPVATEPVRNLAIAGARLLPSQPVAGETAQVVCLVFNATPQPRQESVRLQLAGLTQEATVSVQPFTSAEVAFQVSFVQPGVFSGSVSLPPDDLREDDTHHLVVQVQQALSVLIISDAEPADARSAAFFLTRALAPSQETAPGYRILRRHSQDADRGALETSDVFVLVPPAALSGEAGEILARRTLEGVPLMVVLDGPAASTLVPPGISPPFQLLQAVRSTEGEPLLPGVTPWFNDTDAPQWSDLRVHRHWLARMLDGRSEDMLLSYADGSPALTLSQAGRGQAVFANLPLTPDGGNLIGHPAFPSLVHELLRTLRGNRPAPAITPGEAWTLEAATSGDAPLQLQDPAGKPVEARPMTSGRTTRIPMPTASQPGVFEAKQAGSTVGATAVNVDPRESDTRPIALADLKPGTGSSVVVASPDAELSEAAQRENFWPALAALALLCLAAEMALLAIWRRQSTPASPQQPMEVPR